LIFYKKYDIIYIESKGKEMINIQVIRVKAKVAPKTYTEEHLNEVYQRLANAYGSELERLRNELTFAHQENERLRAKLAVEKKKISEEYDLSIKTSADLATRLVKAMDERDEARAEAADLNLELAERQCRIDELERRMEWLQAHSDASTNFIS
jgi:chromosome segregation ATPase